MAITGGSIVWFGLGSGSISTNSYVDSTASILGLLFAKGAGILLKTKERQGSLSTPNEQSCILGRCSVGPSS